MPDVIDLTNCDREPIHIPGSIQPHGALLACDASVTIVQRHSANAAEMLGLAGPLNDTPIAALLSQRAVHDIRNAATTSGDATRPSLLLAVDLGTGVIADVAVHRINGTVILEFEPAHEGESPLHRARDLISRIIEIRDLDTLLRRGTRLVQALAGYDRVMVYRFTPDGAGKVVSEVKRSDLESFLDSISRPETSRRRRANSTCAIRSGLSPTPGTRACPSSPNSTTTGARSICRCRTCGRCRPSTASTCTIWGSLPPCRFRSSSTAHCGA